MYKLCTFIGLRLILTQVFVTVLVWKYLCHHASRKVMDGMMDSSNFGSRNFTWK